MRILCTSVASWIAFAVIACGAAGQNRSISCDGATQFLTVPSAPALSFTAACTVECWFRYAGTATSGNRILVSKGAGSAPSYALGLETGIAYRLYFGVGLAGNLIDAECYLPPLGSGWHHAAGTYDGANVRLYLDGVEIDAVAATGTIQTVSNELGIGASGAGGGGAWPGGIDEVRLWNVARGAGVIASDRFVSLQFAPGLVAVYRMDGNVSDSASNLNAGVSLPPPAFSTDVPPVAGNYLLAPSVVPQNTWCVFPIDAADVGAYFYFDVSFGGSVPGTPLSLNPLRIMPLNRPLLLLDFGPSLPSGALVDFVGVIPAEGDVFPRFFIPAVPGLSGAILRSSFAVLDSATLYVRQIHPSRTTVVQSTVAAPLTVAPAFGPETGGTSVVVSGANFTLNSAVRFDGVPAPTVFLGPNQLSVVTPPGQPGAAQVEVYGAGGVLTAALSDGFRYDLAPHIDGVVPDVPTPGAAVTVLGGSFDPSCVLSVSGVPVATTFVSATELTFVAGAATPCDATVMATNSGGATAVFAWNPTPVVDFAIATSGPAAGGAPFILLGFFPEGCTVTVGGGAASVLAADPGYLLVASPPGGVGVAAGAVHSASGCAAAFSYTYW